MIRKLLLAALLLPALGMAQHTPAELLGEWRQVRAEKRNGNPLEYTDAPARLRFFSNGYGMLSLSQPTSFKLPGTYAFRGNSILVFRGYNDVEYLSPDSLVLVFRNDTLPPKPADIRIFFVREPAFDTLTAPEVAALAHQAYLRDSVIQGIKIRNKPQPQQPKPTGQEIYTIAEQMPQFPGGHKALKAYLARYLQQPEDGPPGTVEVSFVVDTTGMLRDVTAISSHDPACSAEAIRVFSSMPLWQPARQNGRPLRVRMSYRVSFVGAE